MSLRSGIEEGQRLDAIAAGLTDAQRDLLLTPLDNIIMSAAPMTVDPLIKLGLCEWAFNSIVLTTKGEQVRERLLSRVEERRPRNANLSQRRE